MKTNIVWMSGDYKWSRAYLMNFIPYKAKGHFNIDLKSVEIGFITVYKMTDDLEGSRGLYDGILSKVRIEEYMSDTTTHFVYQQEKTPREGGLQMSDWTRLKWVCLGKTLPSVLTGDRKDLAL